MFTLPPLDFFAGSFNGLTPEAQLLKVLDGLVFLIISPVLGSRS